ncbi:hypothetical protein, partial [Phascolarctobacterium succinatutens]|uniref:hypothetical protein n=1 Tax=Phascolarctobacterium succinatutens TaxID=626940 RepID=UPI0026E94C7E
ISIHAPLRERLHDHPQRQKYGVISIHAPLRERLSLISRSGKQTLDFNPRSLAGATASKENTSLFI